MLDRDLAELYGIKLKALNQAAKRNIERFPSDFMFQLTQEEWDILRSQFATANKNISKVRFLPHVFTEHGVLMLSNVLDSSKAINMSIQIIRIFDKLRKYALKQTSENVQIEELHKLLMLHIENNDYKFLGYDETISTIIQALNNLLKQPQKPKQLVLIQSKVTSLIFFILHFSFFILHFSFFLLHFSFLPSSFFILHFFLLPYKSRSSS